MTVYESSLAKPLIGHATNRSSGSQSPNENCKKAAIFGLFIGLSIYIVKSSIDFVEKLWHVCSLCSLLRFFVFLVIGGNTLLVLLPLLLSKYNSTKNCSTLRRLSVFVGFIFGTLTLLLSNFVTLKMNALEKASTQILTEVEGFPNNASVRFDENAIPHIKASTMADAAFIQGLVMAQTRTYQLEFQRRLAEGRLAAMVGTDALPQDKLFRTLGFRRRAEKTYSQLKLDGRFDKEVKVLESYSEGINAYFLNSEKFQTPVEIILLSLLTGSSIPETLDPWTPAQSLSFNSVMAYGLSGNLDRELLRFKLLMKEGLSTERIDELLPAYDVDYFPTVLDPDDVCEDKQVRNRNACQSSPEISDWLNSMRKSNKEIHKSSIEPIKLSQSTIEYGIFRRKRNAFGTRGASNNWVVSGSKTESGKPILANDPHLTLSAPSVWMLFHLTTEKDDLWGNTFAGLPGIVLGRNRDIAWGVTDTGADIQDLFILNVDSNNQYFHGNKTYPIKTRVELIEVAGLDHDIEYPIQEAGHYGPILTKEVVASVLGDHEADWIEETVLALRWVEIDDSESLDTTFPAFFRLQQSKTWNDFRNALSFYVVPGQNFIFASDKDIGYQMTGRLPRRKKGHTGLFPVPGNGSYDWEAEFVPFEELPHVTNPKKGFIASANNQVQPSCYGFVPTCDWDSMDGYRAQKISSLIAASNRHSVETFIDIQQDVSSPFAESMQNILTQACDSQYVVSSIDGNVACELLLGSWDFVMRTGSFEATIFSLWVEKLFQAPSSETGITYWEQMYFTKKAFEEAFRTKSEGSALCNSHWTNKQCARYAEKALIEVGKLVRAGKVKDYGTLNNNPCVFSSQIFSHSMLDCLMSRFTTHSGDKSSINVGGVDYPSLIQSDGPSYRHIISFARKDFTGSKFVNGLGQNGNPFLNSYDNMLQAWTDGDYYDMA